MAIRPTDFTNTEMQVICCTVLLNENINKALRNKINNVLDVAHGTQDGFFIGSYAGPKFTEIKFVDPDEVD